MKCITKDEGDKLFGRIWTSIREAITAVLAILIIVGTLVLLWPSLTSPVNLTDAQAIFSILGGWGGIIIGYYFGRLPAEKAADKADDAANAARKEGKLAERNRIQTLTRFDMYLENDEKLFLEKKHKLKEISTQQMPPAVKTLADDTITQLIQSFDGALERIKIERAKIAVEM